MKDKDLPKAQTSSTQVNLTPSRPDLLQANYFRHLNECKQIITFLGSFTDYETVRNELNEHIDNLKSSQNEY